MEKDSGLYIDLLNSSPDLIAIHDEKRMLFINPAGAKLLGASSPEEVVGKEMLEFVHPKHRKEIIELLHKIPYDERHKEFTRGRFVRRDGKVIDYEVFGSPITYNGRSARQITLRDITEKKKAETSIKEYSDELEQSNRLKDLFIDIMRHDVLNPAGVVEGMAEIALKEKEKSEVKISLNLILRNIRRIIEMVENASTLAKMESGEKIRFEEKDLGNVLRNVVRELAAMAGEKNVRIKTFSKGEFPALLNPLIFGAFSNLINNAIKYSPENSEITIEIEDEDADWKICIADRGPGVLDENKKIIFERFKRVKKGDIKGTGLGLAIVKSVVDSHKGRVWVEDNPGGGSIFCVALPKITA